MIFFDYENFRNIKTFSEKHTIEEMDKFFDKYYSDKCRIPKEKMRSILHEIPTYDEVIGTAFDLCRKYGQK